jgi:hypothetical protein
MEILILYVDFRLSRKASHFFLRNNESRAKSIPRNFFSEWNFDGNPSLQASSCQMIRDQFCWCWGGGMEDLGYEFFLTSRKIAPVPVIISLRRFPIPLQKLYTWPTQKQMQKLKTKQYNVHTFVELISVKTNIAAPYTCILYMYGIIPYIVQHI